jgi:hypothetical protein
MKADFALVAEYASAPPDGKLYVIGGAIRRVASPTFPSILPNLSLVVSLRVPPAECGINHQLQLAFLDPDGEQLMAPPPFTINAAPNPDSKSLPAFVNIVANVGGLPLPRSGDYAFSLVWAGQEIASVGFTAVVGPPPPGARVGQLL